MVINEDVIAMRNRSECMENEKKPWSDDDSKALADYYEKGVGITEMALIFQRGEPAIYQQLHLMGSFQSPIKRTYVPREPKCLCEFCRVDRALCPGKEHCTARKDVAKC